MSTKINRSKLFKIAHAIIRKSQVASFSEALRLAWKAIRIYTQMQIGKVEFSFRKLDGTVRKAVGTLCDIDYAPSSNTVKRAKPDDDVMCYFDVEKNNFRSFRVFTLI
ncbi:SH3 beta-barrel fold-containing protein [uncultured Duncaniella sp.]|uniref:SH3 beta-barrel fold-containing protein n=1 Tax=uncultured Duncaniella sp. TaxID=2768039 RepID=UPI0025B10DD4|nr:SH3 beta-barrel fold-containing protein [uncultured Duncaniella sp.]